MHHISWRHKCRQDNTTVLFVRNETESCLKYCKEDKINVTINNLFGC